MSSMPRHNLVSDFLDLSVAARPDKLALVHQDVRLTYAEIDRQAARLAAALGQSGVVRGDRVAIFMDNSVETVVAIFAALKLGAAFMVVNHTTKADKLGYILNDSRARVLLVQAVRARVVEACSSPHLQTVFVAGERKTEAPSEGPAWRSYDAAVADGGGHTAPSPCIDLDLASIIYTSGSTGEPKGVMLSHRNIVAAAWSITTYLENTPDDVILNVLPLSFDYGLYQVLMGFMMGATVVLEKSFAYPHQVLQVLARERVTGFPCVPTMVAMMLGMQDLGAYDFSSVRYLSNTAAALPVSHIEQLRALFPSARIYSMYGLTECKRVSYLPPEDLDRKPTSVGKGMPNEEVYVVDEDGNRLGPGEVGELVVRGSNVMIGYWDKPDATAACIKPGPYPGERMLYTGDLFKMDDEGYLYFVARKDDIIKSRGEKVSPKEVENVIYGLDEVLEVAVIGVPDPVLGEAIKALVALKEGATLTERDILKRCAQQLESFMVPQQVQLVAELPKTTTGKISKKDLRVA